MSTIAPVRFRIGGEEFDAPPVIPRSTLEAMRDAAPARDEVACREALFAHVSCLVLPKDQARFLAALERVDLPTWLALMEWLWQEVPVS